MPGLPVVAPSTPGPGLQVVGQSKSGPGDHWHRRAAAPRPELESGFTHWQRGAVAAAARLTEHCAAASAGQPGRGPGVARRCPAESGLGLQVQCANAWRRRRGASGLPGAGSVRHSSVARAVRLDRASRSAAAAGPTGDPSHRARPAGPASPGRAVAR